MSKFMPTPSIILPDKASTLATLDGNGWTDHPHPFRWNVKSQWLCDWLNALEREQGSVYNAQALRLIEKQENIGPYDENGSVLSLLIYNAQGFRRSDALRAQGFEPGTDDMLKSAFDQGKKIELYHDSILGGSVVVPLTVREIGGKLYAMQKGKRKWASNIIGAAVRLEGSHKTELPDVLNHPGMIVMA